MNWHYAWSRPNLSAQLKQSPHDFYVEELLAFEPDGQGEHLLVFIEKIGVNTDYLAKRLAQVADIPAQAVTYSGVKDRHACTRQWFCLHVLNKQVDIHLIENVFQSPEQVKVLRCERHSKKLKIGQHIANKFIIRLRQVMGDAQELETRLALVRLAGVPNYYGSQRFGIHGNNLVHGKDWLEKQRQNRRKLSKTESFWLSAMRSWCFNEALSQQVKQATWNQLYHGDIAQEALGTRQFRVNELNADMHLRLISLQIHPVLPLISKGWQAGTSERRSQEILSSLAQQTALVESLLALDLARDSRTSRLVPQDMVWETITAAGESSLVVQFNLPKGSFATSVLREIVNVTDVASEKHDENFDSE